MTPRGTLELCCVHIAQLMTHPAIYTTPFTLQLCYKPLGILQRLTKSKKAHTSNHVGLENLHNINIFDIDHRVSQRENRIVGISLSPVKFFENQRFIVLQTVGLLFSDFHLFTTKIVARKSDFP